MLLFLLIFWIFVLYVNLLRLLLFQLIQHSIKIILCVLDHFCLLLFGLFLGHSLILGHFFLAQLLKLADGLQIFLLNHLSVEYFTHYVSFVLL
jgi:hypothetical protein